MAPPPRPTIAGSSLSLADQLRNTIASRGLKPYGLGKATGLDRNVIARFLRGERDITLTTADKLAAALDLKFAEIPRKGPTRPQAAPRPKPIARIKEDDFDATPPSPDAE